MFGSDGGSRLINPLWVFKRMDELIVPPFHQVCITEVQDLLFARLLLRTAAAN